jgi:hypothetical protein
MQILTPETIYFDAMAVLERLPARAKTAASIAHYQSNFVRMWREPVLDPLRKNDARDTYGVRRASLFWGIRVLLERLIKKFHRAAECESRHFGERLLRIVARILARVAPILEVERPLLEATADFSEPSRWTNQDNAKVRGAGSKRYSLAQYPAEWREIIWRAVAANNQYRLAIAVMCLSPCRPADMKPGFRNGRFSEGVVLRLTKDGLDISFIPAKSHDGKYGSPSCGLTVKVTEAGPAAVFLKDLCLRNGGQYLVGLRKIDGLRKYLERLGKRTLPGCPIVSAYTFRTQRIADIKATFGEEAAKAAASAAGHCSDRSQRHYGFKAHGRAGGIVKVYTAREPRMVSTPHVQNLRTREWPARTI